MLQINDDPQADAIYIRLHKGEVDNRQRLSSTMILTRLLGLTTKTGSAVRREIYRFSAAN